MHTERYSDYYTEVIEKVQGHVDSEGELPNLKEITLAEWAMSSMFVYSPITTGYHAQTLPGSEKNVADGLKLIFMSDGIHYAIANDYWAGYRLDKGYPRPEDGSPIRVFKFAVCQHDMKEISAKAARERGVQHFGNCYHVAVCSKCDYIMSYDSSG